MAVVRRTVGRPKAAREWHLVFRHSGIVIWLIYSFGQFVRRSLPSLFNLYTDLNNYWSCNFLQIGIHDGQLSTVSKWWPFGLSLPLTMPPTGPMLVIIRYSTFLSLMLYDASLLFIIVPANQAQRNQPPFMSRRQNIFVMLCGQCHIDRSWEKIDFRINES